VVLVVIGLAVKLYKNSLRNKQMLAAETKKEVAKKLQQEGVLDWDATDAERDEELSKRATVHLGRHFDLTSVDVGPVLRKKKSTQELRSLWKNPLRAIKMGLGSSKKKEFELDIEQKDPAMTLSFTGLGLRLKVCLLCSHAALIGHMARVLHRLHVSLSIPCSTTMRPFVQSNNRPVLEGVSGILKGGSVTAIMVPLLTPLPPHAAAASMGAVGTTWSCCVTFAHDW
jgi:hypothetical protein